MMPPKPHRISLSLGLLALYLLTLPVYGLLRLTNQSQALSMMTVIIIVLFFSASMAHLLESRGMRHAALMAGCAFIISLAAEMFGVATGMMFGNYTYSEQLGPRVLGLVPLIIPVAWMMMLYPSYAIALHLTNRLTRSDDFSRLSMRNPISERYESRHALPEIGLLGILTAKAITTVVAALAMTMWDLSLDPRMVHDGNWVWHDGGPYLGIPITNFVGWFLTACVIFIIWQAVDNHRSDDFSRPHRMTTEVVTTMRGNLPIYAYIIQWVAESVANIVFWGNPLVGVAVFIGMGIFSVPAILRLRAMRVSSAQQND